MNVLIERWKAKSPSFWIKIKKYAIAIATASIAVWTINSTMSLELDQWILDICKYSIAISAAFGLSAQLTKE